MSELYPKCVAGWVCVCVSVKPRKLTTAVTKSWITFSLIHTISAGAVPAVESAPLGEHQTVASIT